MSDRRILVLWALAIGLITWREFRNPSPDAVIPGLPRPWAYTGAAAAYAVAAIAAEANADLGVALALAWTVAIFLGYFGSGNPSGSAQGLKASGGAPKAAGNAPVVAGINPIGFLSTGKVI
jgi:hypothetical protein